MLDEHDHEPGPGYELIKDPAALRVLAHPTRTRIFVAAVREPVSAKELAARFEQPLARLSYHVRALAEAGLLRPVRQTRRRGAIETHYRAIATLEIDDDVIESAGPEVRAMMYESALRTIVDDALNAVGEADHRPGDVLVARAHFTVTEEGRERLRQELRAIYERLGRLEEELWEQAQAGDEELVELNVGLLLHPGAERAGRNGALCAQRRPPGEPDLNTIPPIGAERDGR